MLRDASQVLLLMTPQPSSISEHTVGDSSQLVRSLSKTNKQTNIAQASLFTMPLGQELLLPPSALLCYSMMKEGQVYHGTDGFTEMWASEYKAQDYLAWPRVAAVLWQMVDVLIPGLNGIQ